MPHRGFGIIRSWRDIYIFSATDAGSEEPQAATKQQIAVKDEII